MVIIAYIVILGLLVLLTDVALQLFPAGQAALTGKSSRKHALDGTRGVLALSVVIHHLLLARIVTNPVTWTQRWYVSFVSQLGSAAVALFFMISAYLFGGRTLYHGGGLDLPGFAVGRVMRIVPLYVFAVAAVCFVCVASQGFMLVEPWPVLLKEIGHNLLFGFVLLREFDGAPAADMLGTVWTLPYEWLLYATIPLMALLYRRSGRAVALYLPLIALALLPDLHRAFFFIAGLLAAQLAPVGGRRTALAWQVAGPVCLLLLVSLYPECQSWQQATLLLPCFVAVLQGRRWFALLGARPMRFLGEISFSIYLLQGIIFYPASALVDLSTATFSGFVLASAAIGAALIALSTLTFFGIEKRFMHVRVRDDRLTSSEGNAPRV